MSWLTRTGQIELADQARLTRGSGYGLWASRAHARKQRKPLRDRVSAAYDWIGLAGYGINNN
jgi:hypothetical protein